MLAFNEIRHRLTQFVLIVAIVALIGYLVVMISALGVGLQQQAGSYLRRLPVDGVGYNVNANFSGLRSEVSGEQLAAVRALPGVRAATALGFLSTTTFNEQGRYPALLVGYDPGSIGQPRVVEGAAPAAGAGDALLADRGFLRRHGLNVGDTLQISQRLQARSFTIIGAVDEGTFFFQPVILAPRSVWQELRYGAAGERVPAGSVVLMRGDAPLDAVNAAVPSLQMLSPEGAFNKIEGVQAQQQTVRSLQVMGYLIGAMVIGIFFYVLTLQKVPQIGILKALGASSWFVFGQLLIQVVTLTLAGLAVCIPLALATASAIPEGGVPIAFTGSTYVITIAGLLVSAMLGALFSGRQIARVDPIIALGQQQ